VGEREGLVDMWAVCWAVTDGRRPGGGEGQEVKPGVNRASDNVPGLRPVAKSLPRSFSAGCCFSMSWSGMFSEMAEYSTRGRSARWWARWWARSDLIEYVGGRNVSRTIATCNSLTAGLGARVSARYCDCSFAKDYTDVSSPTFLPGLVSTCQNL
jgi:hypothetical protein